MTLELFAKVPRLTGLAGVKQAVGELGRITSLARSIIFIASAPEFTQVHKVADGMTDVLAEVLGEEKGTGGRAAIGVQRLANDICFEAWCTFEVQ
jgi:hypothetical protein